MADVRQRVVEIMKGYTAIGQPSGKAGTAYQAKIISKVNLNYRSGAGTNYPRLGGYKPGTVITILEEKNNWGKTKDGWISLQYIQKEE